MPPRSAFSPALGRRSVLSFGQSFVLKVLVFGGPKFSSGQPTRKAGSSLSAAAAAKLCPTLFDPMDGSPPGSSVSGMSQARKLKWIAISFFGDFPDPRVEPASAALRVDSLSLHHHISPTATTGSR